MVRIYLLTYFFAFAFFCFGAIIATLFDEKRQRQIELDNAKSNEQKTIINDFYALRRKDDIHGLVLCVFVIILTTLSLFSSIKDYEKAVLRDYVNGKYETETVVKTSTRGNGVQADTTLYFHKIKK